MDYKISNRLDNLLSCDKMGDPQLVCRVIEEEIKPIIQNYLALSKEVVVRHRKEGTKNIFFVEFVADRIRPFGYIPQ